MRVPDDAVVVVVGRGRWATKVLEMLGRSSIDAVQVGSVRREPSESRAEYVARIADALRASRGTLAWLCVPPGDHVPAQIEAALRQGIGVVAEKPWPYAPEELELITSTWTGAGPAVVVCFEFVLLDEVRVWRTMHRGGAGLTFHGVFSVSAPDRLGIPPLWNMGSHLAAIREWAVPESAVGTLRAAYDAEPERRVWLEDGTGTCVAEIDLLGSPEPILQRFVAGAASGRGPVSDLDPGFASRVSTAVAALEPWAGYRPAGRSSPSS